MRSKLIVIVMLIMLIPLTRAFAQSDVDDDIYDACSDLKTNDHFDREKASDCIGAMTEKLLNSSCDEATDGTQSNDLRCAGKVKQKLAESTLQRVQDRGYLICGVNSDVRGFSERPAFPDFVDGGEQYVENGNRTLYTGSNGLEADLCRVVAIAVFGNAYNKERTVFKDMDLTSRFEDLRSNVVDVVFRSTTWNSMRDTELGVDFGPVYFHDGQKFLVESRSNINVLDDLNDRSICVNDNTTTKSNLESVFNQFKLKLKLSENTASYKTNKNLLDGFRNSECDAISGDESALLSIKESTRYPDSWRIIPAEPISYEPLAVMVAENDNLWRDLVSYSIWAIIWAEQERISQQTPRSFATRTWESLGLHKDTGRMIVEEKGNYAELFALHLSELIPEGEGRGRNQLREQHEDGWMIVPPMEPSTVEISNNISAQFDTNSYALTKEIGIEIEEFIANLKELEKRGQNIVSIEIIGYTDSRGDMDTNTRLSMDRANAVRAQFENDFPPRIIESSGRGQLDPIASNSTPEGRRKNRRVVVDVIVK